MSRRHKLFTPSLEHTVETAFLLISEYLNRLISSLVIHHIDNDIHNNKSVSLYLMIDLSWATYQIVSPCVAMLIAHQHVVDCTKGHSSTGVWRFNNNTGKNAYVRRYKKMSDYLFAFDCRFLDFYAVSIFYVLLAKLLK